MRGIADHDILAIAADASPARWFGSFTEAGAAIIGLPLFIDQNGCDLEPFLTFAGKMFSPLCWRAFSVMAWKGLAQKDARKGVRVAKAPPSVPPRNVPRPICRNLLVRWQGILRLVGNEWWKSRFLQGNCTRPKWALRLR